MLKIEGEKIYMFKKEYSRFAMESICCGYILDLHKYTKLYVF